MGISTGMIDVAEFFVDRHLSPDAGVARIAPRVLFPRVVAEFAGPRNGVEDPEPLAGLDVVAADEALLVGLAPRRAAGSMRGADDHGIAGDDRRRMQPDIAGLQVHLLIVFQLQIDDAVLAETGDGMAGLRVERDHLISGRDVDDPFLAAVGPVPTDRGPRAGAARPRPASPR